MGSTRIGTGTKLDNLIQIGHNVVIGKNTVAAAQLGVAGSTHIGDSCMFGGQVGIAGHLHIADKVQIASQSGIAKDVTEREAIWAARSCPGSNSTVRTQCFTNCPN